MGWPSSKSPGPGKSESGAGLGAPRPTWTLRIEGPPLAKPRMTQKDRHSPSRAVMRYWGYADLVRLAGRQAVLTPSATPILLACAFHMPFPRSYSKAKRRDLVGRPHTLKPDIKNMIAGVEDSLNKVAWLDDAQIWAYGHMQKFWTDGPGLTVVEIWCQPWATVRR